MAGDIVKIIVQIRDDALGEVFDRRATDIAETDVPDMLQRLGFWGSWEETQRRFRDIRARRLFYGIPPLRLEQLRRAAAVNDPAAPNLNSFFMLTLPPGGEGTTLLTALRPNRALADAYIGATTRNTGTNPTREENFKSQKYLPRVGAPYAWLNRADGTRVAFADVESAFELSNLPPDLMLAGNPRVHAECLGTDPNACRLNTPVWEQHALAVLGIVAASLNGSGFVGIAFNASPLLAVPSKWHENGDTLSNHEHAIVKAGVMLQDEGGGVLLIEQELEEASSPPVEAEPAAFAAIHTLAYAGRGSRGDGNHSPSSNPVVIVEAAGNGGADLDQYTRPSRRPLVKPVTVSDDSGAIMVTGSTTKQRRTDSGNPTNCGGRVDCHAWGESVATLSFSDGGFKGSSPAAAIVAGVCLAVQSHCKQRPGGRLLTSLEMRELLTTYGRPAARRADKLGVMPDLEQTLVDSQKLIDRFLT